MEKESRPKRVSRRSAIRGATAVGIVTVSLPSVASAVSEGTPATTTTTTEAPPAGGYSENGSADPGMAAINAVPVVSSSGSVEVTGSDTVG